MPVDLERSSGKCLGWVGHACPPPRDGARRPIAFEAEGAHTHGSGCTTHSATPVLHSQRTPPAAPPRTSLNKRAGAGCVLVAWTQCEEFAEQLRGAHHLNSSIR